MIKSRILFPDAGVPAAVVLAGPPVSGGGSGRLSLPPSPGCPEREMVVLDPQMVRLFEKATAIAAGNISVLIIGETGTGKELLAEALHRGSRRAPETFLRLNCAAIAETLLESELFGHERGSFTGAVRAVPGLLESADGGTVFLDEVGEMPPALQAKLLRVIDSGEVLRIGARRPYPVDIRFVSATNRDLEAETERAGLRGDLFYRLSGAVLRVPPLRERRSEIEKLAVLFLHRASRMTGRPPARLSQQAINWMVDYHWPGNIRELRNLMERTALLCRSPEIRLQDLIDESAPAVEIRSRSATGIHSDASDPQSLANTADEVTAIVEPPPLSLADDPARETARLASQRARIMAALERCGGNQTRAARLLGISRATLLRRIASLDLPRPRKRNDED
jgi:two-component system, NtrC family, response regulator AtoC